MGESILQLLHWSVMGIIGCSLFIGIRLMVFPPKCAYCGKRLH